MKFGKTTEIERVVDGTADGYTVTARVRVAGETMTGINSGEVKDENGTQTATFSHYGSLSVNFNTTDTEVMGKTLEAINAFTASCKDNVAALTEGSETEKDTEE